jgi:protein NrfD
MATHVPVSKEQPIQPDSPSIAVPSRSVPFAPQAWLWAAGLLALVVGSVGLYQQLTEGLRPTALGAYVPWGLWVATYEYLVWLEIGSLVVFTLMVYVFKVNPILKRLSLTLYLTAFAILSMALILIGLDLGHPFRFWHVLVWPQWNSLMTWMIWAHLVYLVVLLGKLLITAFGKSARLERLSLFLSYLSIPLGIGLVALAGSVFGVVVGRAAWQGSGLPLYFLLSSLVVGTGLLTLLLVLFYPNKEDPAYVPTVRRMSRLLLGLLSVGLLAAALGGLVLMYPSIPAQAEALRMALFGPYWWVYWVVHVGLGLALPALLLASKEPSVARIGAAAGLLIVTFIAVPLNIVIPPQLVTGVVEAELVRAFTGPTLLASYFPTLSEWLVTLFALAFGFLVFLFGYTALRRRIHSDISSEEATK